MGTYVRKWVYVLILVSMVVIPFIPFELTLASQRKLRIIDANGMAIVNAKVRQIWGQYALNIHGEIDIYSGPSGEVFLPRRSVRTSIFSLVAGAIKGFSEYGLDAGFRSAEGIIIFANGFKDRWFTSVSTDGLKELNSGVVILEKGKGTEFEKNNSGAGLKGLLPK